MEPRPSPRFESPHAPPWKLTLCESAAPPAPGKGVRRFTAVKLRIPRTGARAQLAEVIRHELPGPQSEPHPEQQACCAAQEGCLSVLVWERRLEEVAAPDWRWGSFETVSQ